MVIVNGSAPRQQVKQLLRVHRDWKLINNSNKLNNHHRRNCNILLLPLLIMGQLLVTRTLILVIVMGTRAPRYGKESNITITTSTILTTITTPHHQGTRPSECHRQLTQSLFAGCQSSRTVGDTCIFIFFIVVFSCFVSIARSMIIQWSYSRNFFSLISSLHLFLWFPIFFRVSTNLRRGYLWGKVPKKQKVLGDFRYFFRLCRF